MRGRLATACLAVIVGGCNFDSSGGSGGDQGLASESTTEASDSDTTTSESSPATSMPQTSSATGPPQTTATTATTIEPTSTTTENTSTTTETTTGDTEPPTSTTTGNCVEEIPPQLLFVQQNELETMDYTQSGVLPNFEGNPVFYASSAFGGVGLAKFPFEIACENEYYIFGLVFDSNGDVTGNADSYYYEVDADATIASDFWAYGCQSTNDGWAWHRVERYQNPSCNTADWSVELGAGTHGFSVLNREGGGSSFAAIAAIVVTTVPDFDPNDLYDPTP